MVVPSAEFDDFGIIPDGRNNVNIYFTQDLYDNAAGSLFIDNFKLAPLNLSPVASVGDINNVTIPVPVFFEVSPQTLNVKSQGDEFTAAKLVMDTEAAAIATASVPVSLSASDSDGTIASYEVKLDAIGPVGTGTLVTISLTGYITGSGIIEAFDPTGGRRLGN